MTLRPLAAFAAPLLLLGHLRASPACERAAADPARDGPSEIRPSSPAASGSADAGSAPCVKFWGEARSTGYGYRHVVVLKSECKKSQSCGVSTDVAPEVQQVGVAPGETKEVVTFLESPVSSFTPRVVCT